MQNPQPSPWIYLQGVGSGELQSIIKFIYLGETEVDEILLQNVLKLANYLEIKGLTETMCEIKIENESKEDTCTDDILDFTEEERKLFNEQPKIESDNLKIMLNSETDSKQSMTKVRNLSCTKCPYKGTTNKTLKAHIMTKHEGVKFPCSDCPFISNTSKTRYMHTLTKHKGIKFECDVCYKEFADPSSLRKHKKYSHEGVRYKCNNCEFQGTTKGNLNVHERKNHGIHGKQIKK